MPGNAVPPADPYLRRDIAHSLAIAALATLATGGLLYLRNLRRVWKTAHEAPTAAADGDYVLVFGKRPVDGGPDADFRARLARAHDLARAVPTRPLVLMGGGPPGAREADIARRELAALGLPEAHPVWIEADSLDTLQNLRNARDMIARTAPRAGSSLPRVALLSNRYHLARCAALARGLGFEVTLCAADVRLPRDWRTAWRLCLEAGYLCWLEIGTRWARLIGHRRMLARVS